MNLEMIKLGIIVVISLVLVGGSVYFTHKHDTAVFNTYKQEQTILTQQQDAKYRAEEEQHNENTMEAATAYSGTIDDMQSKLDWLHKHPNSNTPNLPSTINSPICPNGGTTPPGTWVSNEFYDKALKTEVILEQLHALLLKDGVQVK